MTKKQIQGDFIGGGNKEKKKKRQAEHVWVAQGFEWERQEIEKPIMRLLDYCYSQDKR